jgi:hypothetical protein
MVVNASLSLRRSSVYIGGPPSNGTPKPASKTPASTTPMPASAPLDGPLSAVLPGLPPGPDDALPPPLTAPVHSEAKAGSRQSGAGPLKQARNKRSPGSTRLIARQ